MHCHGVLCAMQDKLFRGHQMSTLNQMLYVNVCSALVSFTGLHGRHITVQSRAYNMQTPLKLYAAVLCSGHMQNILQVVLHSRLHGSAVVQIAYSTLYCNCSQQQTRHPHCLSCPVSHQVLVTMAGTQPVACISQHMHIMQSM